MCMYRTKGGFCKLYSADDVVSYCVEGPCKDEVLTNADRIRAMSDEELAKWLAGQAGKEPSDDPAVWMDWLKQPAEED